MHKTTKTGDEADLVTFSKTVSNNDTYASFVLIVKCFKVSRNDDDSEIEGEPLLC